MAKQQRTWGIFISQLALAVYFIITAICLISKAGSSISSAEIEAITGFFGKGAYALEVIIGVILGLCGIMFLLKAFGMDFGKFDDYVKYITLILWCIITLITLIFYAKKDFTNGIQCMHWFLSLAKNALIIGGILLIKNGK